VTTVRVTRRWRRTAAWVAALFVAWWLLSFAAAWFATMPRPRVIPERAEVAGRATEAVTTTALDGVATSGWLVRAGDPARAVVLAAGIGGNRLAMQQRAAWYVARGWSALLVDLRGTGASEATRITMGRHEARDLAAWHAFLSARGFAAIGAHGQSLGAAAIVYTAEQAAPPRWHFAVLEACYRDIDAALAARLPLPDWLSWMTWPLRTCAEWLTGVDRRDLVPVAAIRRLEAPTLLACGSVDHKVGPAAAALLFAASGAAIKRSVAIPGVGHIDLWRAGPELPRALAAFLAALDG
jgi:uncharacterized protein